MKIGNLKKKFLEQKKKYEMYTYFLVVEKILLFWSKNSFEETQFFFGYSRYDRGAGFFAFSSSNEKWKNIIGDMISFLQKNKF